MATRLHWLHLQNLGFASAVAALLGITLKTADFHRARVMKKLDVHDVAGLVRYAIREGLIAP